MNDADDAQHGGADDAAADRRGDGARRDGAVRREVRRHGARRRHPGLQPGAVRRHALPRHRRHRRVHHRREGGVAAGVRRVEAVTGEGAFAQDKQTDAAARRAAARAQQRAGRGRRDRGKPAGRVKRLTRELQRCQGEGRPGRRRHGAAPGQQTHDACSGANGGHVPARRWRRPDGPARRWPTRSRRAWSRGVVVLAAEADGKVALVVSVTTDLTGKVKAGRPGQADRADRRRRRRRPPRLCRGRR